MVLASCLKNVFNNTFCIERGLIKMKQDEQSVKEVFVCGGGHQGLSMSAHLALNGIKVTLWNRTPEHIKEVIDTSEIFCNGVVNGTAKIAKASSSISDVISDFVMVATPSSAHRDVARQLAPFVHKDMIIILNPGRTFGAIDFANELQKCGVNEMPHIAETQTIVYTCRRSSKNSTTIFALKDDVKIAALKSDDISFILAKMPMCLKPYFSAEKSVGYTSFSNVGMVLHCSPVMMNIGWIESDKVDFKYYYDGISLSVAKFLQKIDDERMDVAKVAGFKIESVADWLKRTYKIEGENLYECIRNNISYKEIDAPPTIYCRYTLEDVPNGLVPIEFLGKELNVPTPNITTIINLASSVLNKDFRAEGRKITKDKLKEYI